MKIVDGKIVEATENELFGLYLDWEMDDAISFTEFVVRMQDAGCEVVCGGNEDA